VSWQPAWSSLAFGLGPRARGSSLRRCCFSYRLLLEVGRPLQSASAFPRRLARRLASRRILEKRATFFGRTLRKVSATARSASNLAIARTHPGLGRVHNCIAPRARSPFGLRWVSLSLLLSFEPLSFGCHLGCLPHDMSAGKVRVAEHRRRRGSPEGALAKVASDCAFRAPICCRRQAAGRRSPRALARHLLTSLQSPLRARHSTPPRCQRVASVRAAELRHRRTLPSVASARPRQ